MYVCMYVCMYVYVHIHIYIYAHVYVYVYVYMHTHLGLCKQNVASFVAPCYIESLHFSRPGNYTDVNPCRILQEPTRLCNYVGFSG